MHVVMWNDVNMKGRECCMKRIGYQITRVKAKILKSHEILIDYYRKMGVKIGQHCLICSNLMTKEPFLIEIGDNVTISTNVSFVTHDNCVKLLFPNQSDCFGKIKIGNNCFVRQNSTILYGVTIADNVIVAAGSVVSKSFSESNIIIGGNPAKIIGDWKTFKEKISGKAVKRNELEKRLKEDESFLVKK